MRITIDNHVWSHCEKEDIPLLRQLLYVEKETFRPGQFHAIRKDSIQFMVDRWGKFLTGFVPRIRQKAGEKSIVSYNERNLNHTRIARPEIYSPLDLFQKEAIDSVFQNKRGVVLLPTGSGKTVIFMAFIDQFNPPIQVLIIVHTQDLFSQTYERAVQIFGRGQVGQIGSGIIDLKRINVAMIQTLYKLNVKEAFPDLEVVIVDESHHCNSINGTYAQVLKQLPNTPYRIGFTGTLPNTNEGKIVLEGLMGPVIYTKEVKDIGRLAKPKIFLRKIPYSKAVYDLKTYKEVYELGVVYNSRRHRMVMEDAYNDVQEGLTVLILVTRIEHGENLMAFSHIRYPNLKIHFVYGHTQKDMRFWVKKELESGRVPVVIADAVWREGIDIPTLGSVINAAGGKSEIMTIQGIGRGLRKVEGKEDVRIRDYFDPSHRYLVSHFGERICLYFDEGWM